MSPCCGVVVARNQRQGLCRSWIPSLDGCKGPRGTGDNMVHHRCRHKHVSIKVFNINLAYMGRDVTILVQSLTQYNCIYIVVFIGISPHFEIRHISIFIIARWGLLIRFKGLQLWFTCSKVLWVIQSLEKLKEISMTSVDFDWELKALVLW